MTVSASFYLASHDTVSFKAQSAWTVAGLLIPDQQLREVHDRVVRALVSFGASPFGDISWIEGLRLYEKSGGNPSNLGGGRRDSHLEDPALVAARFIHAIPSILRESPQVLLFAAFSDPHEILQKFKSVQRAINEFDRDSILKREVIANLLERVHLACKLSFDWGPVTVSTPLGMPAISAEQFALVSAPDYNKFEGTLARLRPELSFIERRWSPIMMLTYGVCCAISRAASGNSAAFTQLLPLLRTSFHHKDGVPYGYGAVLVPKPATLTKRVRNSKRIKPLISLLPEAL